jgi:hypothetical protein
MRVRSYALRDQTADCFCFNHVSETRYDFLNIVLMAQATEPTTTIPANSRTTVSGYTFLTVSDAATAAG